MGRIYLRQFIITMIEDENGTTTRDFKNFEVPTSQCELGRNFFYENKEELDMYSIGSYLCPDWTNLTIQGNWYAPAYSGLTLVY